MTNKTENKVARVEIQFAVQGNGYRDWYTVTGPDQDGMFDVSRQGSGDYENYRANRKHVDYLRSHATSEII